MHMIVHVGLNSLIHSILTYLSKLNFSLHLWLILMDLLSPETIMHIYTV